MSGVSNFTHVRVESSLTFHPTVCHVITHHFHVKVKDKVKTHKIPTTFLVTFAMSTPTYRDSIRTYTRAVTVRDSTNSKNEVTVPVSRC